VSKKQKDKGRQPPWISVFRHTWKSAAWKVLSVGARATYVELAANYNTKSQNAVFLSARTAAKALGVSKNTAGKWLHELEHYGFIVLIQGHHLGLNGAGKASRYRLTDRYYAGKEPTYDFQNWDGVLFDSEKNPVPKIETPCTKNWDIREGAVGMQMGTTAPIFGT
jgi:Helix-turn-helix domain